MCFKRFLILPLVIAGFAVNVMAQDEQQLHWQQMLRSVTQSERDAAAVKLRGSFQCANKLSWSELASLAEPGTSLAELKAQLTKSKVDLANTTGGACGGGSCSVGYRLDDCYVLQVWFSTRDESVIRSNLNEHLRHQWVEPLKGYSGKWIVYFANGMKSHEIEYEDGKYSVFRAYYPNGQLSHEQTYNAKGIDGEVTGFFPNGKVRYRAYHKDGQNVGKWVWFDENGKVVSEKEH